MLNLLNSFSFNNNASDNIIDIENLKINSCIRDLKNDTIERISPYPTSNTLMDIAWKPNGDYGLIVGKTGTLIMYNGTDFEDLTDDTNTLCHLISVAWKPDGSYALISGYSQADYTNSVVLKFDGQNLTDIALPPHFTQLKEIAWKPDGSYAIILGVCATIFKYDETNGITDISPVVDPSTCFVDLSWKPDGSYALIVGGYDGGKESMLMKYDGSGFINMSSSYDFGFYVYGVNWKPDGSYALIVTHNYVVKYDGTDFTYIANLPWANEVAWKPDSSYALIYYQDDIAKYDGTICTDLSAPDELDGSSALRGLGWKNDGAYALIVTTNGLIVKYDGDSFTKISSHKTMWYQFWNEDISWEPNGNYSLIATNDGIFKFNGSDFEKIANQTGYSISWRNDSKVAIITGNEGKITKYTDTKVEEISTEITTDPLWGSGWKPTGEYALIVGGKIGGDDGKVIKYDGNTFTDLSDQLNTYTLYKVIWSPTGDYALLTGSYNLWKFDGTNFVDMSNKLGHNTSISKICWRSGGDYALALGSFRINFFDRKTIIWKFDGNDFIEIFNQSIEYSLKGITWHPTGKFALLVGDCDVDDDGYVETWFIMKYDGSTFENRTKRIGNRFSDIEWKPNGKYALLVGPFGNVLKYIPANPPPELLMAIPDYLSIYEDIENSGKYLINLSKHFNDDGGFDNLSFYVNYKENKSLLDCIVNGQYLDFYQRTPNWFGKLEFQVKAVDKNFYECYSNKFNITVTPTNDPPIIVDVNGKNPIDNMIELSLIQDKPFIGIINVTEYDGEKVWFFSNLSLGNFYLDVNTGVISFEPSNDNVGLLYGEIRVTDENETSDIVNINFNIVNKNDPPLLLEIIMPGNNSEWNTTDLINFIGTCDDPDLLIPNSHEKLLFSWTSNITGSIGTGPELKNITLLEGYHRITLNVTDSGALSQSTFIDILVKKAVSVIDILPPFVELSSPLPNSILNTTDLILSWFTNHTDSINVSYNIYLDTTENPTTFISENQTESFLVVKDYIDYGNTYYWTVIPYYGKLKGNCTSGIWNFTVVEILQQVYNFNISGPKIININQGENKTEKITITNLGNGIDKITILLESGGLSGLTLDEDIQLKTGESKDSILKLEISKTTPAKDYLIKIIGKSEGGIERELTITVKVSSLTSSTVEEKSSDNLGIIVTVIIIILVIIVILAFFYLKKKRKITELSKIEPPKQVSPDIPIITEPSQPIQPGIPIEQKVPMVTSQPIIQNLCSTCNQPLTLISQNNRNYCYNCKKYE